MNWRSSLANTKIIAKVFRFWPGMDKEPRFDTYNVPYEEGLTALGLLRCVYRTMDPTLAFRDFQCGVGICGTCRLNINGKNTRACVALLKPGETITVEPLHKDKVIRDLATTFD
jgi:succinate dehydrogenase/fumarate reductase-like Fe-S protein